MRSLLSIIAEIENAVAVGDATMPTAIH